MELGAQQQPTDTPRFTSTPSTYPASLMHPGLNPPTQYFEIGTEVFLINPNTGANIITGVNTIGAGFDTVNPVPIAGAPHNSPGRNLYLTHETTVSIRATTTLRECSWSCADLSNCHLIEVTSLPRLVLGRINSSWQQG